MTTALDYVQNGIGYGEVGAQLSAIGFDPGYKRPFVDSRGRKCVTINTGKMIEVDTKQGRVPMPERKSYLITDLMSRGVWDPIFNAASLRRDAWIHLDATVQKATRLRLSAWTDLVNAGLSVGGFNAYDKLTYEYEAMNDPGEAVVDMDGLAPGRHDEILFKTRSIPLPITHSDFFYSARRVAVSRGGGTPLDAASAEAAGQRVAEMIEKTLIGEETGMTFGTRTTGQFAHEGTSTIYGYTNFTPRITKTNLTIPLGSNPEATTADIIAMRESLYARGFYGPFMLYHSPDWDAFLDNDYFRTGGTSVTRTLRERLLSITGISGIRRLDFLNDTFTLIMVQMTSNVVRAINGMGITTVQWETKGGAQLNFKVMAIQVPLLIANYAGQTGIVHATTA